jgi:co-chaperonin GroES (HSP10)
MASISKFMKRKADALVPMNLKKTQKREAEVTSVGEMCQTNSKKNENYRIQCTNFVYDSSYIETSITS